MNIYQIAKICHEANRALCESLDDNSQLPWDMAYEWQKESAVAGVKFCIDNPFASPASQHEAWCEKKKEEGWKYGPVKDPDKKEHPCLVDWYELPVEQRRKDKLFQAIVRSLT